MIVDCTEQFAIRQDGWSVYRWVCDFQDDHPVANAALEAQAQIRAQYNQHRRRTIKQMGQTLAATYAALHKATQGAVKYPQYGRSTVHRRANGNKRSNKEATTHGTRKHNARKLPTDNAQKK